MDQLKRLFTEFVHQNQMKKTVTWKDIEDKNITMIARSFLKLCRYNHMIPGVFEIERLQRFMEITLPPVTNGEQDFYTKKVLAKTYDEDKNYQTTVVEPMLDQHNDICEPQLHFHEFVFLLNLIAWNWIEARDTIEKKLNFFYEDKLKFKKPSEQHKDKDLRYEEVLQRTQMEVAPGKQSEASEEEMDYDEEEYESEEDDKQI